MMLPALDTLRVFYVRVRQGRSPFSADKNHLHHLFVRQHLTHSQATRRVILVHILLIMASVALVQVASVTATIIMQVLLVVSYTKVLHLSLLFQRWYRFIKRLENA
jgi:UDP-GlcNAc:undecaprenyl-phosphate GlcNAc-1-phosphate transferase